MTHDGAAWIEWQRATGMLSEREADRAMQGVAMIPRRWDGDDREPGELFAEWLTLRGQRVIVTLSDNANVAIDGESESDPTYGDVVLVCEDGKPVEVEGVLIALDPYGEVELLCDDGKYHWCWPALDIRPSARRGRE